ncbi:MAG TPA: SDR family oxidoreductase [Sphingobacteriaceae bacterium]|nr:SDR family oxidoreductase [Sphingobacteriaceae bacterium]
MKTILVTGSNGLLGQKITDLILKTKAFNLIATSKGKNRHQITTGYIYEELDICNSGQVKSVLEKYHPDSIIHTAAMTNVDACENDQQTCAALNVDAVQTIVNICQILNIHLVHLSTDFIFDGEAGPYTETDEPHPVSYYGQSKLNSEKIIQGSAVRAAILRTIIVYGVITDMSRTNIVLWAKSALEKGEPINVVNDQWRMPTLAEDLAQCCILAVEKQAEGIYNASGKDFMNVIEIVQQVADYWQLNKNLINPISSDILNQPAKRPKKTGFILDKTISELGYKPHSFKEGLAILDDQLKV